jgi:hypothetical protein
MVDYDEQIKLFHEKLDELDIKIKENTIDIDVSLYKNSKYKITKQGEEVDESLGNAIVTFYNYSKTNISYKNHNLIFQTSLKDSSNNKIPIYINVENEIYKLELKN